MYSLMKRKSDFWSPTRFFNDGIGDVWNSLYNDFNKIFNDGTYRKEDGNIVYELEVPGFNKDNVEVELEDGILTIKGERKMVSDKSVGSKSLLHRINIGDMEVISVVISDGIMKLELEAPKIEMKEVKKLKVEEVKN